MVRRRTFKDPSLQKTYDWFRANRPGPETKGRGSSSNAYYVGRWVSQTRPFAVRGSPAYAGWAAGVDDARQAAEAERKVPADLRQRGWMPTWLIDGTFCYTRPGRPLDATLPALPFKDQGSAFPAIVPDEEGKEPWGYVTANSIEQARAVDAGKFGGEQ
jgi:hypothetical protein